MAKTEKNKTSAEDELLGSLIRGEREAAKITQAEIAEALGVDQSLVSRQESGESSLDYFQVYEYLDVLNASFAKFSAKFETELKKLRGE